MSVQQSARDVRLPVPHARQLEFIRSQAKRKVIRAGRRSGKTTGVAILAVEQFLAGRRVLYATPTSDQIERFWSEVTRASAALVEAGLFNKNQTRHVISRPRSEQRIRAKTAWNADTLRGDYADLLILDEYQDMDPDAWGEVGAPMLLDNNGDAVFVYTASRWGHGAHARALYEKAEADTTGRWQAFRFSSHDNPHVSTAALGEITQDMTSLSYRAEILAEEIDDNPGALWTRPMIDGGRVLGAPSLERIVVGVDPPGSEHGAEAGILVAGKAAGHVYLLDDRSLRGSPEKWAAAAVAAYHLREADAIVAEVNNGGDMVASVIRSVDPAVRVKTVRASRGKAVRAEPVVALYERGRVHHVGAFPELEDQLCSWSPGQTSPDRLDACLEAGTMIVTNHGEVPIESVRTGMMAWTRDGYRRIKMAAMTNPAANIVEVRFSNGAALRGTGNHPVWVLGRGFVPLDTLVRGDMSVLGSSVAGTVPVFNLEVEDMHEYFANGVLVHNCVWAIADLLLGDAKRVGVPPDLQAMGLTGGIEAALENIERERGNGHRDHALPVLARVPPWRIE